MIRPTEIWEESTLKLIGYVLVAIAATAVVVNIVLSSQIGNLDNAIQQTLIMIPFAGVLAWLLRSVPRNGAVWVLAWAAVIGGSSDTASTVLLVRSGSSVAEFTQGSVPGSPSDLDLISALALNYSSWAWLTIFLLSIHFVLLFPAGKVSSFRWLLVMRAATVVLVVGSGLTMVAVAPWEQTPFRQIFTDGSGSAAGVATLLLFAASIASIVNLVMRYRRSHGEERLQYRWVALALGGYVISLVAFGFFPASEFYDYITSAALAAIPVSVGIAITKHRLYDIDVVVSRTLVYGLLALFIGAVYVGIAVVPWVILGSEAESNTWLGVLATVVVAVSFQPLRRRLQRAANRVVFGRRATPYDVLSSFSQGISAVDPEVLTAVAKSLAEGTTADAASIWVGSGESAHRISSWPEDAGDPTVSPAVAPVVHAEEELGKVVLHIPAGQPFPGTDQRLLVQVAGGLGLALRNLQLTEDLSGQVDELRESRSRVVALQDQTRRLLERDLHDGAQQRLVALKIKIGLASTMATNSGLNEVEGILAEVKEEADLTIDSLRNLARGIFPPLLEAEGLGAALSAQLRRGPIPITVQAAGIGRHPEEIEATFYFCVLEAVQNAIKHARARSVLVTIQDQNRVLTFEVRDDGVGFETESVEGGQGLVNMADRLDAVGGSLVVDAAPGRGTKVIGAVPVTEKVTS